MALKERPPGVKPWAAATRPLTNGSRAVAGGCIRCGVGQATLPLLTPAEARELAARLAEAADSADRAAGG